MQHPLDPRFLANRYPQTVAVAGRIDTGDEVFTSFDHESLTGQTLNVPGVPMQSPSGSVNFYEPDPEFLREHGAKPCDEYWRITKRGWSGNFVFYVPAMWGLRIKTFDNVLK